MLGQMSERQTRVNVNLTGLVGAVDLGRLKMVMVNGNSLARDSCSLACAEYFGLWSKFVQFKKVDGPGGGESCRNK